MKSQTIFNIIIIILLITGIYIVYTSLRYNPKQSDDNRYNYEPKIIYIDKPYVLPKPYGIKTQPSITYIYPNDSVALSTIKVEVIPDSIIVILDSLRKQAIHQNFLKLYPDKPKLIYSDLTSDTIRFDLLGIDGIIKSRRYPIYLEDYTYNFDGSDFNRVSKNNSNKLKPNLLINASINTQSGFSVLPQILISRQNSNFSFSAGPRVFFRENPFSFEFNVGYKVK